MKEKILLLTFYLLLFTSNVFAEDVVELTLNEAISIALRENLLLMEERQSVHISEAGIKVIEGEFDPRFKFLADTSYDKDITPFRYYLVDVKEERPVVAEAGIEGKVNTGATYKLKWRNERFKGPEAFLTINPYYRSELKLTITQPLLKGRGKEIQESRLNVARNNHEISKLRLDNKISEVIFDTTMAYWELLSARDELEVAELSLRLARNLLDEAKAKIEAGLLAPVEIYKAEAEVALREEVLFRTKKLVSDAEDRLRLAMNLNEWQKEIIPVDRPSKPSGLPTLESVLDVALSERKELRQAYLEKKNKEILRKFYENQRLPDVGIFCSTGLNGLGSSYTDAVNKLSSLRYYSWQAGVYLSIPVKNTTAKGDMLKARYEEKKADIIFRSLKQKIINEVRHSWRSLQLAAELIAVTEKTRIASEKRLAVEEEKFRLGMSTMNDVLRFQEEYAKSLLSEKKAMINYAKAVVNMERATGTLSFEQSWLNPFL